MRINISNPKECCGCTACESICAHNAIKMEPDKLGFLYPQIDESSCVDCGLCYNVCKFKEEYHPVESFEQPDVYGVRHADEAELAKSQSGAAFWAFAEYLVDEGFVIYGAGYSKDLHVIHKRVTTKEECEELRGSKYTQSDLRGVFKEIKTNLQSGEKILFTGTPCQVAGLKSYIPKRLQDKLITIDLVCHAVPSPSVWEGYVKWIENKYNDKVIVTNFRNKRFGWYSHKETFLLQKTKKEIVRSTFRFFFFFEHLSVRKSCANCKFTNLRRPADLTIGDFWGWEKHFSEWNDNKGVSLLLVNTEKGKQLFENVNGRKLLSIRSNTVDCLQPQLTRSIEITGNQEKFTDEFVRYGFEYVGRKYGDLGWKYKVRKTLRKIQYIFRSIVSIF